MVENQSMASDFNSAGYRVSDLLDGSITVQWTGITGTEPLLASIRLQVSNDNVNWSDWGGYESIAQIDLDDNDQQIFEIEVFTTIYVRLAFESGGITAGDLNAWIHGKKRKNG